MNFNIVFSHGDKVCLDYTEAWPHIFPGLALCLLYLCLMEDQGKKSSSSYMKITGYLTIKPPLLIIVHYLISLHILFWHR